MKKKNSNSFSIFNLFNICILSILALLCIYPIWYVLTASLSNGNLIMQHSGLLLLPIKPNIAAYIAVFKNKMILSGYLNTIKILIISLILQITMTSIGAYFFSRERVLFKKPLMFIITLTMFISGGMIPFYQNLRSLHLMNSHWGLILPFMISTYNMIILKTTFESIPKSLSEAARIDGCNIGQTFLLIMMPLVRSGMIARGIFTAVFAYKDLMWPMIVNKNVMPLSAALAKMQGQYTNNYPQLMAASLLACIPMIILYLIFQKQFVEGIATSGGKL